MQATRAIIKTKKDESAGKLLMKLDQMGVTARITKNEPEAIVLAEGQIDEGEIKTMPEVAQLTEVKAPFPLVSREWSKKDSIVEIAPGIAVGGGNVLIIAGPCAVEGEEQIVKTAQSIKDSGATALRGGAYKPRTSPYSFQGLGAEGLALLSEAKKATGLPIVTEVMTPEDIDFMLPHADILQVGSRNMQNFSLLKALGQGGQTRLAQTRHDGHHRRVASSRRIHHGRRQLQRHTLRAWNKELRKKDPQHLDLNAVPLVKSLSHLPIIVDPSHGTGKSELVPSMSLAALAAGADGLIVEVHPNPKEAVSDGDQSLDFEQFGDLMKSVKRLLSIMPGKVLEGSKCSVAA
ncbi:3-deoxy-7-phosphoheptulonate synthase [Acetomicrobium sp.]|uniref:3-deoxy-7-phosphoheptulonate synthase n=1 Tax=Acetomicrobium sp. TaxID=1872099 RepID=UPI0028728F68|nr:3-deoxy-7-phosphoheptulonate synthase [Acetomicrobium sp.]MDR9769831.1 3-deoxy-7-phosphoheptulonate synthase [Acetomicrobium sp.]